MSNVLFSIQLKIKSQIVNVDILKNDSLKTLVKRLARSEGIKQNKQQKLEDKLIQSLDKVVNLQTTSQTLKHKIQTFILGEREEYHQYHNTIQDIENNHQIETYQNNNIKDWTAQSLPRRNHYFNSKIKQMTQPCIKEFDIEQNQSKDEKGGDQQLIQAYKIIMKKCKKPEIKLLVNQSLKEINLNKIKVQSDKVQTVVDTCIINPRYQTSNNNSNSKYSYSPLRKSLYVFKGNSSNRFHQYATTQENRLYNTPISLQSIEPNRGCSNQPRKFNYLQGEY